MSTESKNRLLLIVLAICLLAVVAEGIFLWQMQDRLRTAGLIPDEHSQSLVEKIITGTDKPALLPDASHPFPMLSPDPFTRMQQRLDSLFGASGLGSAPTPGTGHYFDFATQTPDIQLKETGDDYQIVVPVPSGQEVELSTTLEDGAVTITGTLHSKSSQQQNNFAASLFSQSQFSRTIKLPGPVDEFGIVSRSTDAGIVVSIPKRLG